MKQEFQKFLKKAVLLSLLLEIVSFILFFSLPDKYISPTLPFLVPFFLSVSLIVHSILLKLSEKKPGRFINYFMLIIFVKLFFFIIVLSIYVYLNKGDALQFVVPFFMFYMIYTIFEILSLLSYLKREVQQK